MKAQEKLQELEGLARKKGIQVAYEVLSGDVGSGGLCKVKGAYRVIIDRRASSAERITILADALAVFPLDDIFLPPEVREILERAAAFRRELRKDPAPSS